MRPSALLVNKLGGFQILVNFVSDCLMFRNSLSISRPLACLAGVVQVIVFAIGEAAVENDVAVFRKGVVDS